MGWMRSALVCQRGAVGMARSFGQIAQARVRA